MRDHAAVLQLFGDLGIAVLLVDLHHGADVGLDEGKHLVGAHDDEAGAEHGYAEDEGRVQDRGEAGIAEIPVHPAAVPQTLDGPGVHIVQIVLRDDEFDLLGLALPLEALRASRSAASAHPADQAIVLLFLPGIGFGAVLHGARPPAFVFLERIQIILTAQILPRRFAALFRLLRIAEIVVVVVHRGLAFLW